VRVSANIRLNWGKEAEGLKEALSDDSIKGIIYVISGVGIIPSL